MTRVGEDSSRPATASPFRIPGVRDKQSTTTLSNGAGDQQQQQQQTESKATPKKKSMQEFLQKTSANLKATGARLERRIPRKKSKAVKPASKRNSVHRTSVHVRTFDIDQKVMDGLTRSPREKKATEAFLEKQKTRAKQGNSTEVSPMSSKSQAELDKRPLSPLELEAMLLGAPYFSVQKDGEEYKPEVLFQGGNVKASLKFLSDHGAFGHDSFASSTLSRTRSQQKEDRRWSEHSTGALRPRDDVIEIPNMLTANGRDTGAVGFEHYLQLPIADDVAAQDGSSPNEKRKQLLIEPEALGLRKMNMEHIIDRLTEMGELYAAIKQHQWESPDPWNRSKLEEMGEDLFEKSLSDELGTAGAEPGGATLKTQIEALQTVLGTKALWRDFSNPEWRTRVGELLWAPQDFDEQHFDGTRLPNERDVLLLQITLSAELLMRLLALEALSFLPARCFSRRRREPHKPA